MRLLLFFIALFTAALFMKAEQASACEGPGYMDIPYDIQDIQRRIRDGRSVSSGDLVLVKDYELDEERYLEMHAALFPCDGETLDIKAQEQKHYRAELKKLERKWGWFDDFIDIGEGQVVIFE